MKKALVIISAGMLSLAAIAVYFAWNIAYRANTSNNTEIVYVYPGTTFHDLTHQLDSSNAVKNIKWFKIASKIWKLNNRIKPGRYELEPGLDNRTLVRMLSLGLQSPHNLVLSGNIRTMEKLASIISHKIYSDSTEVINALTDNKLIDSLGFNKYTFPGLFLLNTYEIYWTTTPEQIIKRFHKEYSVFWNENRKKKAAQLELSTEEVITLASIVAEESNLQSEHPVIAGVYLNRIKRGMPLQADPTIKYALNDPSIKRILYKHLEVDSPYNTYKKRGLPPGPITIPAPSVIDAVLDYSKHNYLYFCAKPTLDGSHSFSSTLSQHNRNAAAYQAAISRLQRME